MKCAVIISGQPRNVQECYQNIYDNIIEPNNADVFLHAWIDPEMAGKPYIADWVKPEAIIVQKDDPNKYNDIASNPVPENVQDIILSLYKPNQYIFERPKKFEYDPILEERRTGFYEPQNSFSFFYSMYMANQQRLKYQLKNNIIYDKIMRIRFDNIFQKPFLFKDLKTENTITIPAEYNDPKSEGYQPDQMGMSDRWCVADDYAMSRYTELYLHIEDMVKNNEVIVYNELMIGYWVRKKLRLNIERSYHPYYLKRT